MEINILDYYYFEVRKIKNEADNVKRKKLIKKLTNKILQDDSLHIYNIMKKEKNEEYIKNQKLSLFFIIIFIANIFFLTAILYFGEETLFLQKYEKTMFLIFLLIEAINGYFLVYFYKKLSKIIYSFYEDLINNYKLSKKDFTDEEIELILETYVSYSHQEDMLFVSARFTCINCFKSFIIEDVTFDEDKNYICPSCKSKFLISELDKTEPNNIDKNLLIKIKKYFNIKE